MPFPPLLGVPALLEKAGLLHLDPSHFQEDQQHSGDIVSPANPNALQRLAESIGLWPKTNEPVGAFWNRELPGGTLPPTLRGTESFGGKDITLPPSIKGLKAAAKN